MSVINTYKTERSIQILIISIIFSFVSIFTDNAIAESKPDNIGGQVMKTKTIKLARCPSSPNCVNSQSKSDEKHFLKPIKLKENTLENNRNALLEVINTFPRVKVIIVEDNYVKAEFSSKLFSFVDDVEFVISETQIEFRSASRKGYHDLGANKKRIESIRKKLNS